MIKVAVTGNIGSGKSEFINFISKLGFYYISSDVIISSLYKDFKTRSIILQKLNLNEKNYKQEIISNIHNEVFNRQLKKVIYPFLYSKKKILSQKHKTYQPIFPVTATLIIFYQLTIDKSYHQFQYFFLTKFQKTVLLVLQALLIPLMILYYVS